AADFVTSSEGTGIVHIAAFGEDDINLAKKEMLPIIKHVTTTGQFTEKVKDFADIKVKPKGDHQAGDIEIIKYLANHKLLFAKLKIDHSYPHCYRCETPLLYYAIPAWFINMQDTKQKMIKLNEKINWIPEHLKHGRFKNILETAPDWNISRNRYWASPLPIWKCTCGEFKVIGSLDELRELANEEVPELDKLDLHRPYIDEFTLNCDKCQNSMKRIPEVFDCWFESGAMPFASQHYPFEKNENFDPKNKIGFPGDFIAEYIPQTRTWFYYMLAVSTMLFEETSYLNVVTTGSVLASDGRKMSKSLKNYPDPQGIFDNYGVDALRLYLLATPLMRGEDIQFSDKDVADASNKTLGRLVNIYELYEMYKNLKPHQENSNSNNLLDKWIISKTNQLFQEVTSSMENYELDKATRRFAEFVDDFSTWYTRRSRTRIKDGDVECLETTLWVLKELSKLLAPFAPFHAEWIWSKVRNQNDQISVHLTEWPKLNEPNQEIITEMEEIRDLISKALDLRKNKNLPTRQPLAKVTFKISKINKLLEEVICEEVNVKTVICDETISSEVEFDTILTKELIDEGIFRNLLRIIQDARKFAKLKVGENVDAKIWLSKIELEVFNKEITKIKESTNIDNFEILEGETKVEIKG
ncbi:MAG: isoleucine--tRNA ligase, partial [Proteobacteria bacterium]|nr:isoleucine--tRNA ligase [Pseudomonadota bacterium]